MTNVEQPIAAVVEAARAGDVSAWATLVDAFQDMAVGLALGRLGDVDAARDAAQDAFAIAFVRIDQLRDPAAFAGWLVAIVRSACSRRLRCTEPVPVDPETLALAWPAASAPVSREPIEIVLLAREAERVRAAVEALPEHERTVIALHYLAELPYPQVARFLGISESAARKRAHGARSRLKEILTMTTDHLSAARPSRSTRFRDEVALFAAIRRLDHPALRAALKSDPTLTRAIESWTWEEGFDAGLPAANEGTPLIRAVEAGDPEAIDILLAAGADVDGHCGCAGAETPLWVAVLTGRDEIVERLLDAGADVTATSFAGSTALHVAAQRAPRLMRRLLDAGADPHARDARGRTAAEWKLDRPSAGAGVAIDAAEHLPTGIRALDLLAPIRRGDRQHWPPAVMVGQTVLLFEMARALAPRGFWWIGFQSGPYDRAQLAHHSRELGVACHCRLAAEGLDASQRRQLVADAIAEIRATAGDAFVVLLAAPGFHHEITLALQALADDPSVLLTVVVQPPVSPAPVPGREPPEGFDGQVVLDRRRARRRLFPAIDAELTISRHPPSERHAELARRARALLDRYLRLDPELELPDPATLTPSALAATAQALLRELRQPFVTAEPFHSLPGESTPYAELLDRVEGILGHVPASQRA